MVFLYIFPCFIITMKFLAGFPFGISADNHIAILPLLFFHRPPYGLAWSGADDQLAVDQQ